MPRGRGTASRRGAESRREPHLGGELVALASDLADLPLAALVDLLAQEIVAAFGDSVLVVHAGGAAPRAPTADQHGVFHVDGAAADPGIFARDFDYLLLDGFAPEEVTADLQVTIDGRAPLPRTGGSPRTLVTVLIDDRLPTAPTLEGIPGPAIDGGVHFTPCPLRLDCAAVAARWRPGVALTTFDDSIRDSLARWARAITGRRVGVALSGGGAWGFYHVVALRRLVAAGPLLRPAAGTRRSAPRFRGGAHTLFRPAQYPGLNQCLVRRASSVWP